MVFQLWIEITELSKKKNPIRKKIEKAALLLRKTRQTMELWSCFTIFCHFGRR